MIPEAHPGDPVTAQKWQVVKGQVKVVQVAYFDSEKGEEPPENSGGPAAIGGIPGLKNRRVRYLLAELKRRSSGRLDVFQIVGWNLTHRADVRSVDPDV